MSEIHTNATAIALAKIITGFERVALGTAITVSIGLAGSLSAWADGELPFKNVTVNADKQLVVQFTGGGAPQAPKLMEMPAPNHQLFIDFSGVTLDDNAIPSGSELSKQVVGLPGVKGAHVGVVPNAATPTVRVILDLDSDLVIKPSIAALQDGQAVISLGEGFGASDKEASTTASVEDVGAATGTSPTASPSSSADPAAAYEEYYRKFLQQKQITRSVAPTREWGPRKGTMAEAQAAKHGVRVIGTPLNSPALADIPEAGAELTTPAPVAKRARPVAAKVAAEPAAVEQAAAPEMAAEAAQPAESAQRVEAASAAQRPEAVPVAQPAETAEAPAAQTAPTPGAVSQIADTAPVPKEEAVPEKQPDMVADAESGGNATAAPTPGAVSDIVPIDIAPVKPRRKLPAQVAAALPESESAASPGDDAAASAGAAGAAKGASREQDKPENEPHVSSPADEVQNQSETPKHKAARLYNQARENHMHGHTAQAIAQYQQAIKINPELGEAHSNLGQAYNQQHNYDSALTEFHKALAINPRDAISYNGVGAALRAEHDMPGAIKNWETAVKIDPRLAVAHFNLGYAYESEGDPDRALVSYQAAVANDSHFGEAYYRMGIIMHKKHRLQDARADFKKALTVSSDSDYADDARQKIAAIDKVAK